MRGGLAGRMLAASGLLVLIVAGAFALLLVAIGDEREAERRAERAAAVVLTATTVERLVIDLQTAQRGFIITGQERFLEPWHAALAELPAQEKTLERLITDREQKKSAKVISEAIRSYVDEWSLPLVETARADGARAQTLVADGEGKRRMDAIRAQFQRFFDAESAISADRQADADLAANRARAVGLGSLAGFVLLIILLIGYFTRAVVVPVQRLSAAAGRLGTGDLSARVPEGGAAEIGELGHAFNAMAEFVRESQEELDRFFTLSLEMLCIANLDGYFTRLNPSFERTLGYTAEELMSEPFLHFVHPDDREATLAEVEKLASGIDTVAFENRYRCKDGSYRWILWSSTALRERGLIYAAARDITDRKRAEEEIRALNDELELRAAELESQNTELEAQQAELEMVNQELEVQQAELERALAELAEEKERVEAFFSFGERLASEVELTPLTDAVLTGMCDIAGAELGALYLLDDEHEKEAPSFAAARGFDPARLPLTLEPGAGLAGRALVEKRLLSASYGETSLRAPAFGQEVAVRHELHVPLLQGESVLGVASLARVSERSFSPGESEAIEHLGAQAAVALANALSFRSAHRQAGITRAVLDATADAIALTDLEGNLLVANAATRRVMELLGVQPGATPAEVIEQASKGTTDPERFAAELAANLADSEREAVYEYELAGGERWFRRYTAPVRDDSGAAVARIYTTRDITEERAAENLKAEFVATVSHELRTPLASILGFTELVLERDLDEETRRRYLGTVLGEARRLTDLINDFLDLQRIEEGTFAPAMELLELGEVLREQVELFSVQSTAHELALHLPPDTLGVVGERGRIGQVVGNLLSNAFKYSPTGGRVEVRAEVRGDAVRVAVSDQGLGIPLEQQDRLFTKFFRVDSSDTREIGGTGLGLALAREIVRAHHGCVGFESVEGKGSTFWFELPAVRRGAKGSGRILVVEDDPAAAELMIEYFAADGYEVEVVASGENALERTVQDPPTLVALDIGLAGALDGWQVLTSLKARPETAHIPVIVCTAGNNRQQAAALGAADFLVKPFSRGRVRSAIARLLPAGGAVLVADDEENVRRLVREAFADNGIRLSEAADGEETLELVRADPPDVVILDLLMPKLDGFAVLEQIQHDEATRSIPVIVLTGKQLSEDERRFLRFRAFSVLEKSHCSPAELRRLVAEALVRASG